MHTPLVENQLMVSVSKRENPVAMANYIMKQQHFNPARIEKAMRLLMKLQLSRTRCHVTAAQERAELASSTSFPYRIHLHLQTLNQKL